MPEQMTNDKYATIKATLLKYRPEFGNPHSFRDLYHFHKTTAGHIPFKEFVAICQNMGVLSVVKRFENRSLKRVLIYRPELDKYITGDVDIVQQCPRCGGSGIVTTSVNNE